MKLEYISSKTLNYSYLIGKKVTLRIGENFENSKSLVFYADEKQIGISIAKSPSFVKRAKCSLELLYLENLLRLECTIKRFEDGILYVSVPRVAVIIQQRGDLRVGCNFKCNIERFTTGKIKNISAGGAFISLDSPVDLSFFDTEHFKLCFTINNIDLRITCSTVELTDKFLRVKFENIDPDTKEFITLFCCSTDAENFRRSKVER